MKKPETLFEFFKFCMSNEVGGIFGDIWRSVKKVATNPFSLLNPGAALAGAVSVPTAKHTAKQVIKLGGQMAGSDEKKDQGPSGPSPESGTDRAERMRREMLAKKRARELKGSSALGRSSSILSKKSDGQKSLINGL